jgi:hypothetical protein
LSAFTREYVEELRREGQRKGERIRMLVESLAAKTADLAVAREALADKTLQFELLSEEMKQAS